MARKRKQRENLEYYQFWYDYLHLLAINRFDWHELPEEIDEGFLEEILVNNGKALIFYDEIMEQFLCTRCTTGGGFDIYGYPLERRAYANNGFNRLLTNKDSVLIYNNKLKSGDLEKIDKYAYQLSRVELSKDANVNQQKFTSIVECPPEERYSYEVLMKDYEGLVPLVFGSENFDMNKIKVLNLAIPFIGSELHTELHMTLNDALTSLGIETANTDKNERLITSEVTSNLGLAELQRYVNLNARRKGCKDFNRIFGSIYGTELRCDYRSNFGTVATPEQINYEQVATEEKPQIESEVL